MNKLQRILFTMGIVPGKQNYIVLGITVASFGLALLFGLLAIAYNAALWRILFVLALFIGLVLVLGGSYRLIDWSLSDKKGRARIEKEEASKLVSGWLEINKQPEKKE
ncbi:hypothetical protein [Dictyobacter kobayashii]|uniref:Uncharacterized protein n=1 Tax=Dictyobacter kobayashii TaxID=2014872 RepID=A0A402AQ70_9CHLR|nr:hypothetical protein [Dictyobacter kobayashii]GCE21321.1 hypothetical protein KDK_51210 [Dictyobacter kobayashii]